MYPEFDSIGQPMDPEKQANIEMLINGAKIVAQGRAEGLTDDQTMMRMATAAKLHQEDLSKRRVRRYE